MSMSQLDPGQIIKTVYDETGNAIRVETVSGASTSTAINDGADNTIKATVTASNALKVDNSAVTQPISAASLPLPTGASTEAKQDTGNTSLASIDGKLIDTANGLKVDGSAVTQPISAASLPLPTGAASETTLSSIDSKIVAVDTSNVTIINGSGISAVNIQDGGNSITVDGTIAATQSGTWNINNISGTISLPTGAATSANQTTANTSLSSIDSKTPALGQALDTGSVPVVLTASQLTTLTPLSTVAATQSGTWNINNVSGTVSLPTGAATSANQSTANTSLASIDGKLTDTANGLKVDGSAVTQPISAASLPLPTGAATSAKQPALGTAGTASSDVITVQGIASMTALKVDGSAVTQPVSGTITANAGTGNFTVVQSTGTNLHTVVDSGTVAATQSGGWSTSDIGFSNSEFVRNDYSSVNVTTSAYTQLIASTTNTYQEIEIFDSSGQTLVMAFGGSGSEVNKFLVFPGGNGRIKRNVPSGTRISIKAVSATAGVGEISLNLYG